MQSPPQTHACGYCKKQNSKSLYPTEDLYGNDYSIHQCLECKSYFLAPRPSEELLKRAYHNEYYGHGTDKFKSGWVERVLDYFRGKRAEVIHHQLKGNGRVLDIGCGNGRFLDFLQNLGEYEIHGIELPGAAAERARNIPNLHLKTGRLSREDYSENYFDAITLFHVFEHLQEPKEVLDLIDQTLKPNGTLAISFPNIDSWQSSIFKGKWFHMDAPRHLFFFVPKDFKSLMNERGYQVVRERYFNVEYNPYGTQQSILNSLLKKREVLYEYLKGDREYVKEYSKTNLRMQEFFFKSTGWFFILLDALEALFKKSGTVEFVLRKKA